MHQISTQQIQTLIKKQNSKNQNVQKYDVFRGTDSIVYNVNPTVYLQIPSIFEFENINVTLTQNPYIYIKNTELVTAGGNKYIKIECEGTYNSSH